MMMKHGPVVLRLTTSFSVPGSLPWHVFSTDPTVPISAPLILVRIGASPMPSIELATTGYGIGSGAGAAGVKQTLTAIGVTACPDFSVMTSIITAVTSPIGSSPEAGQRTPPGPAGASYPGVALMSSGTGA